MKKKNFLNFIILVLLLLSTLQPTISHENDSNQELQGSEVLPDSSEAKKEFNPKPASASIYNLGLKSYEQGDIQSAVTYFKKAIDLDPGFVDAYYNLGAIYKSQKNYFDATDVLKKAAKINPKDYEVIFELASCYFEEKDYESAKKYFSSIPNNFPDFNEARLKLNSIDKALAFEATPQKETESLKSQAQLLADKLTEDIEKQETPSKTQEEQIIKGVSAQDYSQTQINMLTKPAPESFQENFHIVSKDFKGPTGIVKDSKNNIYIANFAKDSIEKITPATREVFIEKIGVKGPVGLAIDEKDNLFIANYSDGSIVRVTPDKQVSYLVQKLEKPYYLFYDLRTKKLFATTQGNNALVEIDVSGISKQPITSR